MLTLNKHARVFHGDPFALPTVEGSKVKKGQIFKQRQMAKLMMPTCWPGANMQTCPRRPFLPTYGWGVKGQKGQIFKQCQMAKITVPTCWPRANMQKCPRWPFCPTYGSGVIGQICQISPIPIRRSNYKQRQIVKLLVPTCWPWKNM